MSSEAERTLAHAYLAALQRLVRPGSRVLDMGGAFGLNALTACRLGAGHAYTLQPRESAAATGAIAVAHGCADKLQCIDDLDEVRGSIDVLIANYTGDAPLSGLSLLAPQARAILSRGATSIPASELLSMAVVEAPDLHHRHAGVWDVGLGLDFSLARRLGVNGWSPCRVEPSQLLVAPAPVATCSYSSAMTALAGGADWRVERAGLAHGLVLWTDVSYAEGVVLSGAPGSRGPLKQVFFPFTEPVTVLVGDRISMTLRADGLGAANIWTWSTAIERAGATVARWAQSTFFGAPLPLS